MVDEAEAELFGDAFLQSLKLVVDKLDHIAGLDVDQMVVMTLRRRFIARAAIAEFVTLEDARLLEQPNRPIDGGDRDVRIDRRGAGVQRLDVGMVLAFAEHARDRLALLGNTQPFVGAQRLDVDVTRHSAKLSARPGISETLLAA